MHSKAVKRIAGWGLVVVCLFLAGCGSSSPPPPQPQLPQAAAETWPAFTPDPAWQPMIAKVAAFYTTAGYTYQTNLQDYTSGGDYLNFSLTDFWRDIPGFEKLDANGVPTINYNGTFFYNPETVAEFALSEHGKFLRGIEPDLKKFWAGINKLTELQQPDGSLPYVFNFTYYLNDKFFTAPWTSGMAQGMALSAYARAWQLSGDPKYLTLGNSVFGFLIKQVSAGGDTQNMRFLDPSLSGRIMADEYPTEPSAYTLNGLMFSMLGVYDWSNLIVTGRAAEAQFYFERCLGTLDHILPYYDVNGWTAYDLGHITYKHSPTLFPEYHAIHIYLLHALNSITQDPVLTKYEALWRSYVPQ